MHEKNERVNACRLKRQRSLLIGRGWHGEACRMEASSGAYRSILFLRREAAKVSLELALTSYGLHGSLITPWRDTASWKARFIARREMCHHIYIVRERHRNRPVCTRMARNEMKLSQAKMNCVYITANFVIIPQFTDPKDIYRINHYLLIQIEVRCRELNCIASVATFRPNKHRKEAKEQTWTRLWIKRK